MVQLSPSGQSQINPFQLPRGEQIETPTELIARLGGGLLTQIGQDRKKEQQVNSILNVLFPQGQAAAQAGTGGANPADVGVVPGAATPGFNPSAQPQGIGAQLGLDRDTAKQLFSQNPDLANGILQAVLGKRLDQAKLEPVPGVPGAFFDPKNPSNVIFNDDLFNRARDLKQAGASNTNVSVHNSPLGNKTQNEIESRQFNSSQALGRLRAIEGSFDPSFLTLQGRAEAALAEGKDFLNIANAGDKKLLESQSVFMRNAYDNLNQTLREMSGAAITPQEADRLKRGLPSPSDSPTVFWSKLQDGIEKTRVALGRFELQKQFGINPGFDLSNKLIATDGEGAVDIAGAQIEDMLRAQNPAASEDFITGETTRILMMVFGLSGMRIGSHK